MWYERRHNPEQVMLLVDSSISSKHEAQNVFDSSFEVTLPLVRTLADSLSDSSEHKNPVSTELSRHLLLKLESPTAQLLLFFAESNLKGVVIGAGASSSNSSNSNTSEAFLLALARFRPGAGEPLVAGSRFFLLVEAGGVGEGTGLLWLTLGLFGVVAGVEVFSRMEDLLFCWQVSKVVEV